MQNVPVQNVRDERQAHAAIDNVAVVPHAPAGKNHAAGADDRRAMKEQRLTFGGVVFAVIAVVIATAARLAITPLVADQFPFVTMFAAILITSWYCGLWAGLVAAGLGVISSLYFFFDPLYSFATDDASDLFGLAMYAALGAAIALFIENLSAARRRAETGERIALKQQLLLEREVEIRRKAERSLRESMMLKSAILESALDCIITMDQQGNIVDFNPAAERTFGYAKSEVVGKPVAEIIIPPQLREAHWRGLTRYIQTQEAVVLGRRIEMPALRRDGSEFPAELAITATTTAQGELSFTAYLRDISDRMRAEQSIRQSEQRFRLLAHNAPVMIWEADLNWRCTFLNANWLEFTGQPLERQIGEGWLQRFHPNDLPAWQAARDAAAKNRAAFDLEHRVRHNDGEYRWVFHQATPRYGPDGQFAGYVGSCIDITERKRNEQRQLFMMQELDHRVKNNLAAVLALSDHSLSAANSLEDFRQAFTGRITALARTHALLASSKWEGVDLGELVAATLEPYAHGDSSRATHAGHRVRLPSRAASPMCMAFHELATNAAKYGALSTPNGQVSVRWTNVSPGVIRVEWTESGGPAVSAPACGGFGSHLIHGVIEYELRGKIDVRYDPDGLKCNMIIPTAEEQQLAGGAVNGEAP